MDMPRLEHKPLVPKSLINNFFFRTYYWDKIKLLKGYNFKLFNANNLAKICNTDFKLKNTIPVSVCNKKLKIITENCCTTLTKSVI